MIKPISLVGVVYNRVLRENVGSFFYDLDNLEEVKPILNRLTKEYRGACQVTVTVSKFVAEGQDFELINKYVINGS